MRKQIKKAISVALTALMIGAAAITGLPTAAGANYNEETLLENEGPFTGDSYISTLFKGVDYSVDYSEIEISFKYNSLGTPTDDTGFNDTFEFLVFDTNWGGWHRTTVGPFGPDSYDQTGAVYAADIELNRVYTVSVPIDVIEDKLTTGHTVMGINLQTGGIGNTSVTVTSLKMRGEGLPSEPVVIEGAWRKTTDSGVPCGTLSVTSGTAAVNLNEWNIQISNLNMKDFTSPVVEVTVEYINITDPIYPQSEVLDSNYNPITTNYPQITNSGVETYITSIPNTMTSMVLAYDACTVKKIEIYDDNYTTEKTTLTNDDIITEMGAGWALGNALDSNVNGETGETLWGNPTITRRLFRNLKEAGFKTVKIPVTYLSAVTVNGSTISVNQTKLDAILDRVDEVVQMAVDYDLMVVTNIMHDGTEGTVGKWIRVEGNTTYTNNMYAAYTTIWNEIATKLNKYDQHVIFESMNEIMESGNYYHDPSNATWNIINELNQRFVTTVRDIGGNNATRFLMVSGYNADIDQTVSNKFVMPTYNNSSDRIIVSAHFDDPTSITTAAASAAGITITHANLILITTQFTKLRSTFINNGIPVVISKYAAVYNNNFGALQTLANQVASQAKQRGIGYIYWDDGNTGLFGTGLWDRYTYSTSQLGIRLIPVLI